MRSDILDQALSLVVKAEKLEADATALLREVTKFKETENKGSYALGRGKV